MIIVKTTWAQVPDGTLVVSPATGRIMIMIRKVTMLRGAPGVTLSDPEDPDNVRTVAVDPNAPIDMIETSESLSRAVDILSRSFALQRM